MSEDLFEELQERPEGMSRTNIRDFFKRNKGRAEINKALEVLNDMGLAKSRSVYSSGRSKPIWFTTEYYKNSDDFYDNNDEIGDLE